MELKLADFGLATKLEFPGDKILSLRNRQSFSLFDEIEHILTKKYYYPITTEFQQHVDIILIFKGPL